MIKVDSDFELTKPNMSPSQASFGVSNRRNCDQSGRDIRVMNSSGIDWTVSSIWNHSNFLNHVRVGNANYARNGLETWLMKHLISIWQNDRVENMYS